MNIIYFRIVSTSLAIFLSYFSMWYVSVLWVNTVPSSERNISSVNDTAASTTTQTVLCTIMRIESSCTSDIKTGRWLCRSGKESRLVLPRLRGGGWASVRAGGVGVSRITRQSYICAIYCTILSEIRNSELLIIIWKNQVLKKSGQLQRSQQTKTKFFCQWVEGGSLHEGKGARMSSWSLTSMQYRGYERVELQTHSPIRLHIVQTDNYTAHFDTF